MSYQSNVKMFDLTSPIFYARDVSATVCTSTRLSKAHWNIVHQSPHSGLRLAIVKQEWIVPGHLACMQGILGHIYIYMYNLHTWNESCVYKVARVS